MRVAFLDENKHFAVLQVSTEIRGAIKRNNDCIQLGLYTKCHPVRDRIHALQCYHCQEFGSTSKSETYCKSMGSDATCCFCAGSNESKRCENKKILLRRTTKLTRLYKPANCAKSKSNKERSAAHFRARNFLRENLLNMKYLIGKRLKRFMAFLEW